MTQPESLNVMPVCGCFSGMMTRYVTGSKSSPYGGPIVVHEQQHQHAFMHPSVKQADPDLVLQKKINLTKTVRKLPITQELERAGNYVYDDRQLEIKYDDHQVSVDLLRSCCLTTLGRLGTCHELASMPCRS